MHAASKHSYLWFTVSQSYPPPKRHDACCPGASSATELCRRAATALPNEYAAWTACLPQSQMLQPYCMEVAGYHQTRLHPYAHPSLAPIASDRKGMQD